MNAAPTDHHRDFIRRFLYGTSDILSSEKSLRTSICMDERMEGWIGIPHGGITMGIMMDMISRLDAYPKFPAALYPLSAEFRLGGASLKIGNTVHFAVSPCPSGAEGEAVVQGDPLPYMSSSITYGQDNTDMQNKIFSFLPERVEDVFSALTPLPVYKKCFVCGQERNHPGLRRSFYKWNVPDQIVISTAGYNKEDADTFFLFQHDGFIHPLPFLALLDETLGWGGFFLAASGAVTVKIDYTFYRPVRPGEKLIFWGRGERVRGRTPSRLLFWAAGGATVVNEDGRMELVVSASGQWYGLEELTKQMKEALQPKELMEKAFSLCKI